MYSFTALKVTSPKSRGRPGLVACEGLGRKAGSFPPSSRFLSVSTFPPSYEATSPVGLGSSLVTSFWHLSLWHQVTSSGLSFRLLIHAFAATLPSLFPEHSKPAAATGYLHQPRPLRLDVAQTPPQGHLGEELTGEHHPPCTPPPFSLIYLLLTAFIPANTLYHWPADGVCCLPPSEGI